MTTVCQHCGGIVAGDDDLLHRWRDECSAHYWPVLDNRVSEQTAAKLLGMSDRKLVELRKHGSGPIAYRLPVCGSRYSYDLGDLARFRSAHRSGDDWDEIAA